MPNGDLFNFVNSTFDEGCARFMFKHILRGIETLHKDGFAHMDIKLGNILLDSNYMPKLSDFGFCQRITKGVSLQSKELKFAGTKHYI
mmetsp:Transcript_889/g.847  ORF Transcript_889/g.847 Transcript_889/m.847 type:complete len:88 (+) Transcript_889:315-578(+)